MSDDWFRNTNWNEGIERMFCEKLRRARRKASYLRIQASTLARSHPEVALELLKQYFALPDDFDHAQAYVDRAQALLALGRTEEAISSYEAALAREAKFPNLLTQAYLDLPWLIVSRGIREMYGRALQILETHKSRLMFQNDQFRWNAARFLIAVNSDDAMAAKAYASRALDAASRDHSGFRYHPTVGLVTDEYNSLIQKLKDVNG